MSPCAGELVRATARPCTGDPLCIAVVTLNPESRVKVAEGPVKKDLMQQGWRTFLVKVHNEAGVNPPAATEAIRGESPPD